MPYASYKSLPEKVKKALPITLQKKFVNVFNTAYKKYGEEKAFKIAWASVKKDRKGNNFVAKAAYLPNTAVHYSAKSESAGNMYLADFVFADIHTDLDGDEVAQNTLLNRVSGLEGDLEHANLFAREDVPHDKLFKVVDSFYQGDKLIGKVQFYPEHPMFQKVWTLCKAGDFGISMEYTGDLQDIKGISGTVVGRNPRSKIIAAYEQ